MKSRIKTRSIFVFFVFCAFVKIDTAAQHSSRVFIGAGCCGIYVESEFSDSLIQNCEQEMRSESVCDYWQSKVILCARQPIGVEIDKKNPDNILSAIRCLLALKGNKNAGISYARMRPDISVYSLEPLTAELAALFYISYLYYGNNEFALAVILVDTENNQFNTQHAIDRAYELYNVWYEKILTIGLEKARESKLDPLKGSDIQWY